MSELIVLAYADEHRAAEVLASVQRFKAGGLLDTAEAVSVVRRSDWTVILQRGVDLAASDDRCDRFWRELISSLILAPGVATLRRNLATYGIDPSFERRLLAALPPGSSAVFMIVPQHALPDLQPALESFGGTLTVTPIERSCDHAAA